MSKASRRIDLVRRLKEKKAAMKNYKATRETGPCFVGGCPNNGDFKDHCRFCEFYVQSCTLHQEQGRNKAKRHLFVNHPAKTIPRVMMGVLRGDSLE